MKSIRYRIPGMWIIYSGDEKTWLEWLRLTFVPYLYGLKIWFSCAVGVAADHGWACVLLKPPTVSHVMVQVLKNIAGKVRS